ncbi:MAG TPA: hypothetical protein DEF43_18225 [Chloroflexus aurantiacus]|nr:MAG: hypothetical protein D6716_19290 [Chloroflexota bacterium]HBW69045.1 hypothetical protein [Chloroflexus aurantiacus]
MSTGIAARSANNHLQCHHALDWLRCTLAMGVSPHLECGSVAAAPAIIRAGRVSRRSPLVRGCCV